MDLLARKQTQDQERQQDEGIGQGVREAHRPAEGRSILHEIGLIVKCWLEQPENLVPQQQAQRICHVVDGREKPCHQAAIGIVGQLVHNEAADKNCHGLGHGADDRLTEEEVFVSHYTKDGQKRRNGIQSYANDRGDHHDLPPADIEHVLLQEPTAKQGCEDPKHGAQLHLQALHTGPLHHDPHARCGEEFRDHSPHEVEETNAGHCPALKEAPCCMEILPHRDTSPAHLANMANAG
mmetsp:Transcript_112825/g.158293  ORF Transcript_112825/g.158293 Transcript_112825/m.158293 type:complete len:237 (+) Transcript_112825:225-935(+)